MDNTKKLHWEKVYTEKSPDQVSWTQSYPTVSMEMIKGFNLDKSTPIIDIGGGDSLLVDFLLQEGYTDITVVDISARALQKAKQRLGDLAGQIDWIVADIMEFEPQRTYAIWHDRATFHFLDLPAEIERYVAMAEQFTDDYLIMATFSPVGPEKCSGLPVSRYDEKGLQEVFKNGFTKIESRQHEHLTPMHSRQDFLFCSFTKKKSIRSE
ncbi:class I SAM-dependent methyltransferase [Pedobacter sp. SG908]|uniref:class I SAM-dependent methyltransferase n=1 Tax=Pedobacter sp. SG908 TaxID=2587135 RepID=UPI00141E085C|nr:class I SAM-dependent methyltransferase [Pedobacter sp. SG908]NII82129.1 SAM-dependent methyltransferase [Pedobacter sp. SG908]